LNIELSELLPRILKAEHFEFVATGLTEAAWDLSNATKHLASATSIRDSDPVGAFQLAYDAARKSAQAVLSAHGLRITHHGGHFAFVVFAESGYFSSNGWSQLRNLRKVRNRIEYPEHDFSLLGIDEVESALVSAWEMHREADGLIAAILEE
jgi:hypothetical protein